ncbi:LOW QUALITY PROTEIN: hypothetical protein ACG7TL_003221 [Trametes sanguinea]
MSRFNEFAQQFQCSSTLVGSFPEPVPGDTVIPTWAYLNLTANDKFDASRAQDVASQRTFFETTRLDIPVTYASWSRSCISDHRVRIRVFAAINYDIVISSCISRDHRSIFYVGGGSGFGFSDSVCYQTYTHLIRDRYDPTYSRIEFQPLICWGSPADESYSGRFSCHAIGGYGRIVNKSPHFPYDIAFVYHSGFLRIQPHHGSHRWINNCGWRDSIVRYFDLSGLPQPPQACWGTPVTSAAFVPFRSLHAGEAPSSAQGTVMRTFSSEDLKLYDPDDPSTYPPSLNEISRSRKPTSPGRNTEIVHIH